MCYANWHEARVEGAQGYETKQNRADDDRARIRSPAGGAWTQTVGVGAIAGVVKDTSGGVLPGVTVEATSPALIEKVRTVVTDDRGQYKIVNLRPGTYSVAFTLAGFSTFKREGLVLVSDFTAPVNAEMKVGELAETITVTGQSPVVDIQNVRTQAVISGEVQNTIRVPEISTASPAHGGRERRNQ